MTLQDLGALGEVIGAVAVVVSLVYVAHQIRQSSSQIELNSRHIQASMYHETNVGFVRWMSMLAQDESLANIWYRGIREGELTPEETLRFNFALAALMVNYEGNFEQLKLGTIERDTLKISGRTIIRALSSPMGRVWWSREAPTVLTSEFRAAVDELLVDASEKTS